MLTWSAALLAPELAWLWCSHMNMFTRSKLKHCYKFLSSVKVKLRDVDADFVPEKDEPLLQFVLCLPSSVGSELIKLTHLVKNVPLPLGFLQVL